MPEGVAAEVIGNVRIGEAIDVVDVGRVEIRTGPQAEDAFVCAKASGKIVGEDAAADARARNDDVEIVPRPDVLKEEPFLRRACRRHEVPIVVRFKAHAGNLLSTVCGKMRQGRGTSFKWARGTYILSSWRREDRPWHVALHIEWKRVGEWIAEGHL